MVSKSSRIVFFRNDDVNILDCTFIQFVELFISRSIPLVLAVEPANVTPEMVRYLLEAQAAHPVLVEIVQHGWSHAELDRGEFGGSRPYPDQLDDIHRGFDVMQSNFGAAFFPAFTFPFGQYNRHTIRVLSELGYRVFSSKYNHTFTAQLFYRFGRLAQRKWMFGRRISYHLRPYPGSNLDEISVSISPIKKYFGPHGSTDCAFESLETLKSQYLASSKRTPVVGIVLHHRYHAGPDRMSTLAKFVEWLSALDGVRFMTLQNIHQSLHRVSA
ncbi:MAG: polysaccharide deacetylase family protein [Acidobacteria bacterium]|nr:polysaccharide deacetylase family protein [Acidobacteriota bacterium]